MLRSTPQIISIANKWHHSHPSSHYILCNGISCNSYVTENPTPPTIAKHRLSSLPNRYQAYMHDDDCLFMTGRPFHLERLVITAAPHSSRHVWRIFSSRHRSETDSSSHDVDASWWYFARLQTLTWSVHVVSCQGSIHGHPSDPTVKDEDSV